MVENIKLSHNKEKTILNLKVTLSLIEGQKEHFLAEDAIKYLNDNKIYFIKLLNGAIISNVSDRRRVGTFSFLIKSPREENLTVEEKKNIRVKRLKKEE